ncbi:MAG: SapC family protein [Colwellia sp.]|nr:SapC family protein [Colwellia sp.]
MTNIIPLNHEQHASLKITENKDFTRFKNQHLIPVLVQDFIPLASEFPVVFVKNTETGQFTAVAMMGIKSNINLYCQTANWPAEVMPTSFFNFPLSLVKESEDNDNCFVCIDTDASVVNTHAGQSLFNEKGEQTNYLKAKTDHLLNIAQQHEQTSSIVQYFARKKLLTLKTLNLNLGEEQKITLDGLYVIDEQKLTALSDKEFTELRNKGLLPIIYAHLSSMHQIARLAKMQIAFDKS